MQQITYHKATLIDTSLLVENRILFAIELSGDQDQEAIRALSKQLNNYFSKAMSENTCISFFAKCDGVIAGIGSLHLRKTLGNFKNPSGKWGYIMNMYTLLDFRKKGNCRGILELLVEEGKKNGVSAFELHAKKDGEFVYRQCGFEIHAEPTYRKFTFS